MNMPKKTFKKVITIILAAMMLFIFLAIPANAIDPGYIYVGSRDETEGALWWKKTYTYKVYEDPNWARAFYPNKSICSPYYHQQGGADFTLSYTQSGTISAQVAVDFSRSLGLSAGSTAISIMVQVAQTFSTATGMSWAASGGVAASINSIAPTGYYLMVPARNFRRYETDKMLKGTTNVISSEYSYGIVRNTYLLVIYDTSNAGASNYHVYG